MSFLLSLILTASALAPVQVIPVTVDEAGFHPAEIQALAGHDVHLKLTRTTDDTCATSIVVPSMKISQVLPLNKEVTVVLKDPKQGNIKFGCQMNMMLSGVVVVN